MSEPNKKLNKWLELYQDAKSKRNAIDERITRRKELYKGTNKVRDKRKGGISERPAYCARNMCFELIEAQINNGQPQPKVTPRDKKDSDLANEVEGYLKNEADRLQFEIINDSAERECLTQGTVFYLVGWDNMQSTPITQGELTLKGYSMSKVYPQPGVTNMLDMEYIFCIDTVSVKKIKNEYNAVIVEGANFKGLNELITVYYLNKDGYLSRYGWVENVEIFDEEAYELRRFRKCNKCLTRVAQDLVCPICGNNKFDYYTDSEEMLTEDIVKGNVADGSAQTIAKKESAIPYYSIRQLPFIIRRNISDNSSLYGLSDIDLLENDQESINKIHTKIEENILKSGSLVTLPAKVQIPMTDETLRIVRLTDPSQDKMINVHTLQANIQQDDIYQDRLYQFGRGALGITDAYQGKRDPTAESGKAKEVAASQSAGRLESKKRMKDVAYADLYMLMFKFLLAYCDEKRTFSKVGTDGKIIEGKFSRYNFLDGVPDAVYYNDRFLFSVDNASVLSTNRESMWQETLANFQAGTFGNPADPMTLLLFWTTMKELGYPLANQALTSLQQRMKLLPFEMQQAIMQNPRILEALKQQLTGEGTDVQNSK